MFFQTVGNMVVFKTSVSFCSSFFVAMVLYFERKFMSTIGNGQMAYIEFKSLTKFGHVKFKPLNNDKCL